MRSQLLEHPGHGMRRANTNDRWPGCSPMVS